MYENARIGIAVGVYVEISSATRDTAADIFAVVLEIHRKHRLCRTYLADTVIHIVTSIANLQTAPTDKRCCLSYFRAMSTKYSKIMQTEVNV